MGHGKRAEKNQSFFDVAKSIAKNGAQALALSCISLALFNGCGSSSTKNASAKIYVPIKSSSGKSLQMTAFGLRITTDGNNSSPSFSKDGQNVLFVSRDREAHKQSQVYIFDLNNLSERRITFQDGNCSSPIFSEDGKLIFYASTTDELKERPPILEVVQGNGTASDPMPYEIYKSDLAGAKIERLTRRPGFDGDLFLRPDRPSSIIYSQWKNKKWDQRQINWMTGAEIPLMEKNQFSIENMRLSPSGKYWIWIEKSTVNKGVEVVLASPVMKKERSLTLSDYEINEITWGNDETLVASLKLPQEKNFQIYSFDIMSGCLSPLVTGKADLYEPQVSKDEQAVIFTAQEGEKSQIYLKSVKLLSPTCIQKPN